MSEEKDGGPAFPTQHIAHYVAVAAGGGPGVNAEPVYEDRPGMSLRDWFAGQALGAIMADSMLHPEMDIHMRDVAHKAYVLADAMLKARKGGANDAG